MGLPSQYTKKILGIVVVTFLSMDELISKDIG